MTNETGLRLLDLKTRFGELFKLNNNLEDYKEYLLKESFKYNKMNDRRWKMRGKFFPHIINNYSIMGSLFWNPRITLHLINLRIYYFIAEYDDKENIINIHEVNPFEIILVPHMNDYIKSNTVEGKKRIQYLINEDTSKHNNANNLLQINTENYKIPLLSFNNIIVEQFLSLINRVEGNRYDTKKCAKDLGRISFILNQRNNRNILSILEKIKKLTSPNNNILSSIQKDLDDSKEINDRIINIVEKAVKMKNENSESNLSSTEINTNYDFMDIIDLSKEFNIENDIPKALIKRISTLCIQKDFDKITNLSEDCL